MDEPDLDRLSERLELVPGIRLALLFGSRHRGRPRPDSDVDVALLCDAPVSAQQRFALAAELETLLGREVDVVDLHDAPEPLAGEALGGRRLLERGDAWAELPSRHLARLVGKLRTLFPDTALRIRRPVKDRGARDRRALLAFRGAHVSMPTYAAYVVARTVVARPSRVEGGFARRDGRRARPAPYATGRRRT